MRPAPLAARAVAAAALVLTGVILVPPYGAALASDAACLPLGPVVGSFSEFVHHGAPPTARRGDPSIDVDTEFAALRRQSVRWAHLRATPATRVGFRSGTRGVLDLEGMDPSVNVFSVPALDLNHATQLYLKVPDGSSTLVNVSWGSQRLIDLERGGRGLDAVFVYDSSKGAFVADQPPASSVEAPSDAYRATRRRILWNLAAAGSDQSPPDRARQHPGHDPGADHRDVLRPPRRRSRTERHRQRVTRGRANHLGQPGFRHRLPLATGVLPPVRPRGAGARERRRPRGRPRSSPPRHCPARHCQHDTAHHDTAQHDGPERGHDRRGGWSATIGLGER